MPRPTSPSRDSNWKCLKSSPTSEVPPLSLSSWMTRWTADSQKRVQALANSTGMCGIWEASQATKIKVYQTVVLTTLLYGCETWTIYQRHIKKAKPLSHDLCEEDSWHHMAKTHPGHRSFNSGFSSQYLHHLDAITASLGRSCCLHERLPTPKETAIRRIVSGQALPRRAEKRYKDTLKVSLKSFGIDPNCLTYLAHDRDKWHEVVKRGAKVCETRRNAATDLHRKHRKGTATSAIVATIPCSHYPRLFRAHIGLISHLCTHGCLPQS